MVELSWGFIAIGTIVIIASTDWYDFKEGRMTWSNTYKYFIPLISSNKVKLKDRILVEFGRVFTFVLFFYVLKDSDDGSLNSDELLAYRSLFIFIPIALSIILGRPYSTR